MEQSSLENDKNSKKMKEVFTTPKSEQHQHVNEEKFQYVQNHSSQRHLQRSEVRIDGEDMHQFQK